MSMIEKRRQLDKANELKEEANQCYVTKDYRNAIRLYHQCLLYSQAVHQLSRMPESDREKSIKEDEEKDKKLDATRNGFNNCSPEQKQLEEEADLLTIKCFNNLSACLLNSGVERTQKDYFRVVEYCDKVLSIDANNEKALFRKGQALSRATLYDKAIDVLKRCGNNGPALREIAQCERLIVADRKVREAEMRRNFLKHTKQQKDKNGDEDDVCEECPNDEKENGDKMQHNDCNKPQSSTNDVACVDASNVCDGEVPSTSKGIEYHQVD